ncbi:hypothetical protein GW935_04465 [Candidatus Falkowbacteria bacterium]|nr:hypothetical protein [Candidatus Falkowbacteria bacterium]
MNNAKFTFYYLLSLVALLFTAIGTGIILFQIINSVIADAGTFNGYTDEAMRFGIAALLVAAPLYFFTARAINDNLVKGLLSKDGPVRRWLTYLILFAASVTVLGWVIGTINMFLSGDLTIKFALKLLTVLVIAGVIFGFYLYDIRRGLPKAKDLGVRLFLAGGLLLVIGVFVASWFFVDSPKEARAKRLDNTTINELLSLNSSINEYYSTKKVLPTTLAEVLKSGGYISEDYLKDDNDQAYEYKIIDDRKYELCANFLADSKLDKNSDQYKYSRPYPEQNWNHGIGRTCFELEVPVISEMPVIKTIQ